ncbi:hypothetical protein QBC38DRAFT_505243 [Podospora fimiseda]|uniref:Uncharacterized protein n=1 Tax=Podospora fimiseda TaxID=252190 RepID=A0AAN6YM22_9PEZI|nr:hypothetical protein QBC38DRAFT_505243 [Podospora fimiseda]
MGPEMAPFSSYAAKGTIAMVGTHIDDWYRAFVHFGLLYRRRTGVNVHWEGRAPGCESWQGFRARAHRAWYGSSGQERPRATIDLLGEEDKDLILENVETRRVLSVVGSLSTKIKLGGHYEMAVEAEKMPTWKKLHGRTIMQLALTIRSVLKPPSAAELPPLDAYTLKELVNFIYAKQSLLDTPRETVISEKLLERFPAFLHCDLAEEYLQAADKMAQELAGRVKAKRES